MSANAATGRTIGIQNPDPPSIEITPDSEADRNDERNSEGRISERRNSRQVRFSTIMTVNGLIVTVSHVTIGLVLIAVGCVLKTFLTANPKIAHLPSRMYKNGVPITIFTTYESTILHQDSANNPPLTYDANPVGLEEHCQYLTCSIHLPLICIGIGTVFMICGLAGGLMLFHKMNDYVCCHLVWVSISALCAITLSAACMMDLKNSYGSSKGLIACICVLIASTILEALFCAVDIYHVTTKRQQSNHRTGSPSASSTRNDLRSSSRGHSRSENVGSRGNRQTGNVETSFIRGESVRSDNASSANESATRTTLHTTQTNNSRNRRNGQGVRDRNSLHPGHHQQTRSRTRRRPMLRTQNHYVLVPAAYGRPRVSSRVRRHASDRRNRADMPMFVIANHDRYVQELNRSMETLEMEPNRGSVPSNVLASAQVGKKDKAIKETSESELTTEKRVDEISRTRLSVKRKTELCDNGDTASCISKEQPVYSVEDAQTNIPTEASEPKRNLRNAAGYSVVRRIKKNTNNDQRENNQSDMQVFPQQKMNRSSKSIEQASLGPKFGRAASVVEDSVFYNSSSGVPAFTEHYSPSPPSFGGKYLINERTVSHTRLYNTSSEGDFSTISTGSSVVTPSYDRTCHASVSSDSGIIESARGHSKAGRRHYHNVPMHGSGRRSLELRDFDHSKRHSALSPVSPATPSYENINARLQAGSTQRERDAFIFATYATRSSSADLDEYSK